MMIGMDWNGLDGTTTGLHACTSGRRCLFNERKLFFAFWLGLELIEGKLCTGETFSWIDEAATLI
jgi:hypothetical protein